MASAKSLKSFRSFLKNNYQKIILENTSPIENDVEKFYKFILLNDEKNELICTNYNKITKSYINIIKLYNNDNGEIQYDCLKFNVYTYLQYFQILLHDIIYLDYKLSNYWFELDVPPMMETGLGGFNDDLINNVIGDYDRSDDMICFRKFRYISYEKFLKQFKKKNKLVNKSDNDCIIDYIKNRINIKTVCKI